MAVRQQAREHAPGSDAGSSRAETHRARPGLRELLSGGGTSGNERLTAVTGAALLVLLAVLGVTILRIGQLLSVHLFVGMLLIPPVLLKLASTGYRFVRYYTANPSYRRKGPPLLALRMLAPLVVASTLVVFASGVALLFAGPSARSTLLPIHKVSFFAWLAVTAVHVLAHLPELPRALRGDYARSSQLSQDVTGRAGRVLSLAGALTAGVVLAILLIPEFGPWLHSSNLFHHH
jgi:membrane protein implicated in regulation of membrane protease activity